MDIKASKRKFGNDKLAQYEIESEMENKQVGSQPSSATQLAFRPKLVRVYLRFAAVK